MDTSAIAGVILAGGQGRRMFPDSRGDKALIDVGGTAMLDRIIARFAPQVGQLIINSNADAARFKAAGVQVLGDNQFDGHGPLAGLLAALEWALATPEIQWLASVPVDVPFLPLDLVSRLQSASCGRPVVARSQGRTHPVVGLWPLEVVAALRDALSNGRRSVHSFATAVSAVEVSFPCVMIADECIDPFFNANTPEDAAKVRALIRSQS